jgi:hypothetical protein
MEITLNVTMPDDVAADIQNGSSAPLARRLLELAAIQAYESDLITKHQVKEMLGFESRWEVDALFKSYDIRDHSFTVEDLEKGQALFASTEAENLSSQELAELEVQVQAQGHKFYGIFADDPGALEVFDEIDRLRDQETIANSAASSQP